MHFRLKHTVLALLASVSLTAFAQKESNDYKFKYPMTPTGLDRYATSVVGHNDHTVYTMAGHPMSNSVSVIHRLKLSPTGVYFGILTGEGKKARLSIYRNHSDISTPAVWNLPVKKLGLPSALAFSPDGRTLMVSNPTRINVLTQKGRKFELTDTIPLVAPATELILSNNGFYAATVSGDKINVYNLQEKKLRSTLNIGEPITDIMFTDDSSELGVLTSEGVLRLYDTRTFLIKNSVDDLGQGIAFAFNGDGKYVAVATSPTNIAIINLVSPDEDKIFIDVKEGGVSDLTFITDAQHNTVLASTAYKAVKARRMAALTPFYGKLVSGGADELMNEWMKMRPDETMEEYKLRVNPETIARQRQLFEDEIATGFANNLLSMSSITLGEYDPRHELQEVNFDNMPSIYLPVPQADKTNFTDASTLEFRNVRYGIMPNDKFEMIYADVYNSTDGKTYTFDNVNRQPLAFMVDEEEDDPMTLEVIQQQQMEELRLQEIKQRVVEEAKKANVISDHTNITVDSRLEPAFNANGDKILNYRVKFTYEVEPEYSVREDFLPGKYHVNESGAAKSMLAIVKEALEGDFSQYVKEGKRLNITLRGTADASPIRSKIAYDGSYGDFEDEPVTKDGQLTGITVTKASGITENEQLAFLRAAGVKQYLLDNIQNLDKMNPDFNYSISIAEGKGSEFRRITAEFTFIDVF